MLVFIDESGDAGFKLASSEYLIIALVIFDDYDEADKTRQIIRNVMKATEQKPEFKFSKCKNDNKDAFFQAVNLCNFRIRYICLRKKSITSTHLRENPVRFYNYALKLAISHAKLENAKIRIDGNGKKELSKALIAYLRSHTNQGVVNKLKMVDSHKEELIQLANMVVGALARSFKLPINPNSNIWKNRIKKKIDKDKGE